MKQKIIKNIYSILVNKIFHPFVYINIKPIPLELNKDDKCLVIAPHPDDESIGCGGILNLYPQNFNVICLSHGDESDIRYNEFKNAMEFANITNYKHLNLSDKKIINQFDKFREIDISKYNYIFIPYIYDQHRDHKAVSILLNKLIKTSSHKADLKICFYEVWSTINIPQYFIDISSVKDKKIEMINIHKSQIATKDYANKIIGLNQYRGLLRNLDAVESFSILNINDFDEIINLLTD